MAQLDALLGELASLDARHDLDGLRRVREQIATEHPDTDAAAQARKLLGG